MVTVSIGEVLVSGVHAHVKKSQRKFLWSKMKIISQLQKPWVVLGDFNAIISPEEKFGGKSPNKISIMDFIIALMNIELFLILYGDWGYKVGLRIVSDHAPLLCGCASIPRPKNVPWKFQKMWIDPPSFLSEVKKVWTENIIGDPSFIFMQKLKKLKKFLSEWNWSVFGNINTKIKEAEEKVQKAMELSYQNPLNEDLLANLVAAQNEHAARQVQENTLMRLRSRAKWIKDGSTNTAYFHARIKIRQERNTISELENANGNIINDQSQIADTLVKHFQQKFEAQDVDVSEKLLDVIPSVITDEYQEMLDSIPTTEETKKVVFEMDSDSAPGPDGFPGSFYKSCWDIIQLNLKDAIQFCWRRRFIPKGLNSNFLTLIPKCAGAKKASQYRPIGLSNILFKIFSKIISVRMNGLIEKLISSQQAAYVKGRSIQEQILLASEMVNEMRKKRRGGNVAFKLDISQAYDSMINKAKRKCFIDGTNSTRKQQISSIVGMDISNFPDKYLGIILAPGRVTTEMVWPTVLMLQNKLAAWKGRLLSFHDRLILVKTVLCSYPLYNMEVYKWPSSVIKICEKLIRNFLWSGDGEVRKYKTLSWKKICVPYIEGGLGIRRLEVLKKILLMKMMWKSIGNGASISVWFDNWYGSSPLINEIGYTDFVHNNMRLKVQDLIINDQWNIHPQLQHLLHIDNLPHIHNGNDSIIWNLHSSGVFNNAKAVEKIRHKEDKVDCSSYIWRKSLHPNIASNIWKLPQGVYVNDDMNRKQGYEMPSRCCICKSEQDFMEHTLWLCDFSVQVWNWLGNMFQFSRPYSFSEGFSAAKQHSPIIDEVWIISACTVIKELWFQRNIVFFEGGDVNIHGFKNRVMKIVQDHGVRIKGVRWNNDYENQILSHFKIDS
ncbi:uncharacterized protein LOC113348402 [Papaver somniferum]|uniref:uncharacterized protein LOC113348402 n=1 Tax=Papaver somniferum TaxID=3469 RepID=UPI000E7028C0|nr:uncharacterized protein LOC113348402 [Papaver somniferum]